nr:MAG TPA: hypothetical protein [Caudoviricetes sp.]
MILLWVLCNKISGGFYIPLYFFIEIGDSY